MTSQPSRRVRPTLRCLTADLVDEIQPASARDPIRDFQRLQSEDRNHLLPLPLEDLRHPVLDKAQQITADPAAHREPIELFTDRRVIKVKISHHRGALTHVEGRWWLLAAGIRKDDGNGDFYRDMGRFQGDSSALGPTDADLRYERLERAFAEECAEERRAHADVIGAVLLAAANPGTTASVEVFGADVEVTIVAEGPDIFRLTLMWRLLKFDEQDRFPHDVLCMVPGGAPLDDWDYVPPRAGSDGPHHWFVYVPPRWVEELSAAVELDARLPHGPTVASPTTSGAEKFSHRAPSSVVIMAYATGVEITAICGAKVVAHRDYEQLPECPACAETLQHLRSLGGSPG